MAIQHLTVEIARDLTQINHLAGPGLARLWLCSAYVSHDGVAAVDDLLRAAPSIDAIFGAGPLTDPAALRALGRYPSRVHLVPHGAGAEFHPKCYMGVRQDGEAWAAVGSANLTGGGAGGNIELLTTVTGPPEAPFFVELGEWLAEMQSYALPLTAESLAALEAVHRRGGAAAAAAESAAAEVREQLAAAMAAGGGPLVTARDLVEMARMHRAALLHYIDTTSVFASYKLVILGLLLQAPGGRLSLRECARRFRAFYLALAAAGQQPERATGNPPPDMLHPDRPLEHVEQLLMKEPRTAFRRTGMVVQFGQGQVALARPLWAATSPESRRRAVAAVQARLEAYYGRHTGSARAVRAALDAAGGGGGRA